MSVIVITPPAAIVTLAEAKRHLRVDADDTSENEYIESLIAVAQGDIDGPLTWFKRSIGVQVLEVTARAWACGIVLPGPPVVEVVSVSYFGIAGAPQTLDPAGYMLDCGKILALAPGAAWPSLAARSDAIRVRYRAGYPDESGKSTVPPPIRHAVLLMVGRLYAQRGGDLPSSLKEDPTCERLLQSFRIYA